MIRFWQNLILFGIFKFLKMYLLVWLVKGSSNCLLYVIIFWRSIWLIFGFILNFMFFCDFYWNSVCLLKQIFVLFWKNFGSCIYLCSVGKFILVWVIFGLMVLLLILWCCLGWRWLLQILLFIFLSFFFFINILKIILGIMILFIMFDFWWCMNLCICSRWRFII